MEQVRLNKYLAQCGICSRRDADKLIDSGAVLVNGQRAERGMQVTGQDEIQVSGKKVYAARKPVVLAFYKPFGVTCTERDAHAERIISDLVKYPERVTYAGRLDKDSEGLLLLSNDGGLIQAMMKGANRHEKEYLVRVDREIGPDFTEKMARGVFLEELQIEIPKAEEGGQTLSGLSFVITGSLKRFASRNELKEAIESKGGKVTGSVTGKTTCLINNDVNSASSKNKKARELGIPVLSEADFLEQYDMEAAAEKAAGV